MQSMGLQRVGHNWATTTSEYRHEPEWEAIPFRLLSILGWKCLARKQEGQKEVSTLVLPKKYSLIKQTQQAVGLITLFVLILCNKCFLNLATVLQVHCHCLTPGTLSPVFSISLLRLRIHLPYFCHSSRPNKNVTHVIPWLKISVYSPCLYSKIHSLLVIILMFFITWVQPVDTVYLGRTDLLTIF